LGHAVKGGTTNRPEADIAILHQRFISLFDGSETVAASTKLVEKSRHHFPAQTSMEHGTNLTDRPDRLAGTGDNMTGICLRRVSSNTVHWQNVSLVITARHTQFSSTEMFPFSFIYRVAPKISQ